MEDDDKTAIFLNGVKITTEKPDRILSDILKEMQRLDLFSAIQLIRVYSGLLELMIELCHDRKKEVKGTIRTSYTKGEKKFKQMLRYTIPRNVLKANKQRIKNKILLRIYDLILDGEGLHINSR